MNSQEDEEKKGIIDEVEDLLSGAEKQKKMVADGNLTSVSRETSGVIQKLLTAEESDKSYRQILKMANWKSTEEMDKAVNALACCDMTGATNVKTIILDKITAHSAGEKSALIRLALEGLTHTTITSNRYDSKKRGPSSGLQS